MHKTKPTTIFQYNSLIRHSPSPSQSLLIYTRSLLHSPRLLPNKFTFTFLLSSLLHSPSLPSPLLSFLPHLHCHVTLLGLSTDPFLLSLLLPLYSLSSPSVSLPLLSSLFSSAAYVDPTLRTALVTAYSNLLRPDLAQIAFNQIRNPNSISWSALISAYARAGRPSEALSAFSRMRASNAGPTASSLLSALAATSALASLPAGESVHCLSVVSGPHTPKISTAILSMYANCGSLDGSIRAFDEIACKDSAAYTAMMSALASHGRGFDAVRVFDEMVESRVLPDYITFVTLLQACGHAGMVEEAKERFGEMRRVYGIEPRLEHYGCMVDVLGRAGRVEEAWEFVKAMPVGPDEYVLKSLLSACCENEGFVECAEWAAERLRRLDEQHASSYVLLSNVYGGMGRWEESARVRRSMKERGVSKLPGHSAVD